MMDSQSVEVWLDVYGCCGFCSYISNYEIEANFSFSQKKRNSFFGALCKLDDVWSIEVCPALLFWRMTQSVEVRLGVSCGFCSYISNYGIEADFSFLQKK
jgi:ferredoxin-like protein FixX